LSKSKTLLVSIKRAQNQTKQTNKTKPIGEIKKERQTKNKKTKNKKKQTHVPH
jgi:hypothetical protein